MTGKTTSAFVVRADAATTSDRAADYCCCCCCSVRRANDDPMIAIGRRGRRPARPPTTNCSIPLVERATRSTPLWDDGGGTRRRSMRAHPCTVTLPPSPSPSPPRHSALDGVPVHITFIDVTDDGRIVARPHYNNNNYFMHVIRDYPPVYT